MGKHVKRIVSTSFWEDPKVMTLFTPEDKYFMFYLLTNPHTTQLGIYQLVPKVAAFEMGYSVESVTSLIERFEKKYGIVKYNPDTMEIAIKNYLKYSVVTGGKPVLDCLKQDRKKVKDKSLLLFIAKALEDSEELVITVKNFLESVKEETEERTKEDKEENNDNDNDNDNDSAWHDSCHDSCKTQKPLKGHDWDMAVNAGFTEDSNLLNAYIDFFKMRKSIKKPLTDRAIVMLKNRLEELAPGDIQTKIAILNQSSFHCWQSVYELKNDSFGGREGQQMSFFSQNDQQEDDWQ